MPARLGRINLVAPRFVVSSQRRFLHPRTQEISSQNKVSSSTHRRAFTHKQNPPAPPSPSPARLRLRLVSRQSPARPAVASTPTCYLRIRVFLALPDLTHVLSALCVRFLTGRALCMILVVILVDFVSVLYVCCVSCVSWTRCVVFDHRGVVFDQRHRHRHRYRSPVPIPVPVPAPAAGTKHCHRPTQGLRHTLDTQHTTTGTGTGGQHRAKDEDRRIIVLRGLPISRLNMLFSPHRVVLGA